MAVPNETLHTNLAGSLRYLAWYHLAGAVLEVYRENERLDAERRASVEARSDEWATCDMLREELWVRVRAHWCELSGHPPQHFPYSHDAVAKLYFRFRKRSDAEVAAFEREIKMASGRGNARLEI